MSTRVVLAVVVSLAAVVSTGRDASAQKGKAASACGVKLFPLTVGNKWTFIPGAPPAEPPEAMVRFIPPQPKQIVVTVTGIQAKDGKSIVSLEEDVDGRKIPTTITCGAGSFEVSPDSFFFAGEPGGYYGITFENMTRKIVEGEGLGAPWSNAWREDFTADWKRVPEAGIKVDLGAGKIELERRIVMGRAEPLNPPYKQVSAQMMRVELTGRVTIVGIEKPSEMPANWVNALWFADGLGPVQVLNSYFQMYQLSDATIVK